MNYVALSPRLLASVGLVLLGLGSCFAEPLGGKPMGAGGAPDSGGMASIEGGNGGADQVCEARPAKPGAKCTPVRSAEPLLSRVVVDEPQDVTVFVDDLYQQFKSNCGGCHIDGALGGFHVNGSVDFRDKAGSDVLEAIRSNTQTCEKDAQGNKVDPTCFAFMPPAESNGKPWSEREKSKSDAVRDLSTLIEVWLDSATPPPLDVFTLPADKGGKTAYAIDEAFATSFTNMGTCIPDVGMFATELERSCALDAEFAALKRVPDGAPNERIGLPRTLNETDLFTLDSAVLAQHGVIAYAPTYPLWTDDAGKLRFVRVPRGQSISYDAKSGQFDIPDNTRFYKTFLKEVLTLSGEKRFKKIETRVIVSRQGQESLYGTYAWNEQETQATLVEDPLRNGEPFRDRLITVVTDELKYQDIYARVQSGELRNLTYELEQAKVIRHYAIPGSERCVQCHMGSPNDSFILGFTPLQVNQRPCEQETLEKEGYCEGGILHATGPDELSQLQRLIDYGVITGFDPQQERINLEAPQGKRGSRPMRSPQELVAQGYLLGNCSHCHNPKGYPSVLNPELVDLLDFLPSEHGGIFGFPLDRFSPRIKRGRQAEILLPYITPSLRDIIPRDSDKEGWTKKSATALDASGEPIPVFIDAPWRSLIYRNVDSPFTYADDFTIYPHMPLNSPGFDCRAPRIVGDWMVSIPAKRKHPALSEDKATGEAGAETDPQPYVEIKADDPGYLNAQAEARKRLAIYRKGDRYESYCPDTSDIVDIDVMRKKFGRQIPGDGVVDGMPIEGVPDRPHWVITDLTEVPGPWNPRRGDWKDVLLDHDHSVKEKALAEASPSDQPFRQAELENEKLLATMLEQVGYSQRMQEFAETPIPFGLWKEKDGCKFPDSVPTVDTVKQRWRWMDATGASDTAHVYEAVPGALVFNMICVNCHGPEANSRGRQASTLQEMTGGDGRVANFRDGLFGPYGSGGDNRQRIFESDDLARHYLAWMALGGTNTKIPAPILALVAGTPVLGETRVLSEVVSSANMLQVAQALCSGVARLGTAAFDIGELGQPGLQKALHTNTGLMEVNGDAQMWKKLCSIDNPPPVRALHLNFRVGKVFVDHDQASLFWPQNYPSDAWVGDLDRRVVKGISPDNFFPWCIVAPAAGDAVLVQWLSEQRAANGEAYPICPDSFLVEDNRFKIEFKLGKDRLVDVDKWAMRGAVNAGIAVFSYLNWLVGDGNEPLKQFNECEKL
jgi:mono/diheme cytochrome c family protein